jgi:hypothetical protein
VVNGFVAFGARPDDFSLKRLNPRIKFGDRIGIKVERDQKGERVAGTRRWRDVVGVHDIMVTDGSGAVNGLSGQPFEL